jgi:hypothetical protein
MKVLYTVQKRGDEFWVVSQSSAILNVEDGPHADIATANARADTLATALEATRNTTNDLEIHVAKYPV